MRQVWMLALAQTFAQAGTIIFITYGGILGAQLAPSAGLVTLPLALSVFGVAATSFPAAMLMRSIGRRKAFISSALLAGLSALICAYSVAVQSFGGLCAAAVLFGSNMAFVQQYRFAAIDLVAPDQAAKAVATVMVGPLAAALLWPELGDRLRLIGGWPEFTGSFLVVAVLCLAAVVVLSQLPAMTLTASDTRYASRPLREILGNTHCRVAIFAGICSYAVMSFIMTATPISMHVIDALSVAETKRVISTHLVAMFLPSLFSGWLIQRFGLLRIMLAGVVCMTICVIGDTVAGHRFVHYLLSLALLGAGWNFLFVGGTTLLTGSYAPADRFRVQGINDLSVFGTQALASLLAGPAILYLGWGRLNLLTLPLLVLMAAAILRLQYLAPLGADAQWNPGGAGHLDSTMRYLSSRSLWRR